MNIGFDLDKIFIQYPPFIPEILIDKAYKRMLDGKLKYRVPPKPEQLLRSFLHQPIFRQPIKNNIAFVKKLTKQNSNKHYLISGRFGFLKSRTNQIIKKHGFDKIFDGLYFNYSNNQPHLFKNEIIKKLRIDLYVDDDLQLLEHLCKDNPKIKFFWLNKNVSKELSKNLFAIKNLSEMFAPSFHLRGVPQAQHHLGGGRRTPAR